MMSRDEAIAAIPTREEMVNVIFQHHGPDWQKSSIRQLPESVLLATYQNSKEYIQGLHALQNNNGSANINAANSKCNGPQSRPIDAAIHSNNNGRPAAQTPMPHSSACARDELCTFPSSQTVPSTPTCNDINDSYNPAMKIGNIAVEQPTIARSAFQGAWSRLKPNSDKMDVIHKIFDPRTWIDGDELYIEMNDALNKVATAEKFANMSKQEWDIQLSKWNSNDADDSGDDIMNDNCAINSNDNASEDSQPAVRRLEDENKCSVSNNVPVKSLTLQS